MSHHGNDSIIDEIRDKMDNGECYCELLEQLNPDEVECQNHHAVPMSYPGTTVQRKMPGAAYPPKHDLAQISVKVKQRTVEEAKKHIQSFFS